MRSRTWRGRGQGSAPVPASPGDQPWTGPSWIPVVGKYLQRASLCSLTIGCPALLSSAGPPINPPTRLSRDPLGGSAWCLVPVEQLPDLRGPRGRGAVRLGEGPPARPSHRVQPGCQWGQSPIRPEWHPLGAGGQGALREAEVKQCRGLSRAGAEHSCGLGASCWPRPALRLRLAPSKALWPLAGT